MAVELELDAPFWGFMGAAFALIFSNLGAAYGTGKSGIGIASLGVSEPDKIMKSIVPVVMAGVLGIYGLIIAVIIANNIDAVQKGAPSYNFFKAFAHLGGGLACGLSGLAAGMAIGIVGDTLTRASAKEPKLFVGMVLILIFAEALGLYGLIVGLILASKAERLVGLYVRPMWPDGSLRAVASQRRDDMCILCLRYVNKGSPREKNPGSAKRRPEGVLTTPLHSGARCACASAPAEAQLKGRLRFSPLSLQWLPFLGPFRRGDSVGVASKARFESCPALLSLPRVARAVR
eukprot:CAMPEP_0119352822 /NCGR_PEP_ID=MMETSP1334-20130426/2026_1 /TAXON_ID=127549 /ORGANISM="Calcidiscus leptoporus, Strain RCC1130" /LENGTH=289 /DNA_ID=CAMNT_0007365945 /DNA_START=26 /DNA_END=896 /DNA_ORIENTATION=-